MTLDELKNKLSNETAQMSKSVACLDSEIAKLGNRSGRCADGIKRALWDIQKHYSRAILMVDKYEKKREKELREWSAMS